MRRLFKLIRVLYRAYIKSKRAAKTRYASFYLADLYGSNKSFMGKFFEATQISTSRGASANTVVANESFATQLAVEPAAVKPTRSFLESTNEEDERCKQELLAHLNRFSSVKQPVKLGQRIANFFKSAD